MGVVYRGGKGQLICRSQWALLKCDDEIGAAYRSLYGLEYFYKPKIQKPLWGSHISIIRGEITLRMDLREKLRDLSISFFYIPQMQTNGIHFWLPVICPLLDDIREAFGLGKSLVDYHLTIGNILDGSELTKPEIY